MQVTLEAQLGKWQIVAVAGRVDAQTSSQFDSECRCLATEDLKYVALDCSHLEYLSSAGLRVILVLSKELKKKGGELALVNPNDYVKMVLQIAGLDQAVSIFNDVSELN